MAYITTENLPLNMPVPGTREPAQIALLNENSVVLSNHDHTDGKALAVGRLRSGLEANRPLAGSAGNVYFSTDTGKFFVDTGTVWVEFITSGGQATVTGWTLVDPIIRDTIQFGPEGSGTVDATLSRTGPGALRADKNLGVGVTPAAWDSNFPALQLGLTGALWANNAADALYISTNTYFDGLNRRALTANLSTEVVLSNGVFQVFSAPSVAAGAVVTPTQRLGLAPTGTLTLTPDAGQAAMTSNSYVDISVPAATPVLRGFIAGALKFNINHVGTVELTPDASINPLVLNNPATTGDVVYTSYQRNGVQQWYVFLDNNNSYRLGNPTSYRFEFTQGGTLSINPTAGQNAVSSSGPLTLNSSNFVNLSALDSIRIQIQHGAMLPSSDAAYQLGGGSNRWSAVYASNGTIQTSSADLKQDITPLDPAACYQAAKDVRWYDFRYQPPAFTPPEPGPDIAYDEHDDNDTKAEKRVARDEAESAALAAHAKMLLETAPTRHQRGFVFPLGVEAQDEAGGALPPVPDLFGLDDRQSTTPQADLATIGAALQYLIQKVEALEAASGQAPAA